MKNTQNGIRMKKLWPKQNRAVKVEGVVKIRNRANHFFLYKKYFQRQIFLIYIYIFIRDKKMEQCSIVQWLSCGCETALL